MLVLVVKVVPSITLHLHIYIYTWQFHKQICINQSDFRQNKSFLDAAYYFALSHIILLYMTASQTDLHPPIRVQAK